MVFTRGVGAGLLVRLAATLALLSMLDGRAPVLLLGAVASVHPLTAALLLAILVAPRAPLAGAVGVALVYASGFVSRDARPALLASVAGLTGVLAGYYALLFYQVLLNPPGAPLVLREALAKIYSSYTLRFASALAVGLAVLYLYSRLARLASEAFATPWSAWLLVREWILGEAERVERLRTWYHGLLFYALGALIALPVSILTSALIAVIYAGLALVAPPRESGILEALSVARGVITLFLFAVLDYLMASWARGLLAAPRAPPRPSRFQLIGAAALLAFSLILALLHDPSSLVYALNPFSPPPPPSSLDREAGRVLAMLGWRVEMSEKALRAILEFLWGG